MGSASRVKSHAIKLLVFLVVLGLVVAGSLVFWLMTLDRRGTFHNTADLADLDGDGDLDVILHNVRNESEFTAFSVMTLWINHGDGVFLATRLGDAQWGVGYGSGWASSAGDVDLDGDVDLVVFPGWYLSLLLNQGGAQGGQSGAFGKAEVIDNLNVDGQFGSVTLGDLNNDGQVDGIIAGCCGRQFTVSPDVNVPNISWVWINARDDGDNSMSHTSVLFALDSLSMRATALGDLDGDGDLDLLAAVIAPRPGRNRDPADRVLFNDGTGNFADSGQRLGETDSTAVALGDLDGDGDLDALVGTERGATVWINQGGTQGGQEGIFALAGPEISGSQTGAVFLSDLDRDGDLDALIAGLDQAAIWQNDGRAGFMRSSQRFRYSKRHGLAIGDLNGDGRPDVFAAAYSTEYRVWFNRGDGTFRTAAWPIGE